MHRSLRQFALPFALLLLGVPAHGQDQGAPDDRPQAPVEITPFVSLESSARSRIGAAIRFAWTSRLGLEAETGYRDGAINAHLSLLYDLPRVGRVRPYLAAGGGLEQYGTALLVPDLGLIVQERVGFSLNAGGGVKVPVTGRWGIRTDARWFNGLGRDAPERWRVFNGVTFGAGSR